MKSKYLGKHNSLPRNPSLDRISRKEARKVAHCEREFPKLSVAEIIASVASCVWGCPKERLLHLASCSAATSVNRHSDGSLWRKFTVSNSYVATNFVRDLTNFYQAVPGWTDGWNSPLYRRLRWREQARCSAFFQNLQELMRFIFFRTAKKSEFKQFF